MGNKYYLDCQIVNIKLKNKVSFLARADVWGTSFSVHLFINEGLARAL